MFLVTGATGNVGGELVRALARDGQAVRAVTRAAGSAQLPAGVTAVSADLNQPDSVAEAAAGARAVFLLPGYQNMAETLARLKAAGVERVVLLSGSSAENPDLSNAVTRYMVESENAVRESDLPWTILRPSGFMSNTLQWVDQLRAGELIRAPFAGVRVAMIDPYDIAAVAALACTQDGHAGQIYRLSGPESLLPADRAGILAEVLGRPLRFEGQPDDEARAEMSAAMPVEYVDAFFSFYADGTLDESPVLATVPELTGRPARTFEQWAREHANAFA